MGEEKTLVGYDRKDLRKGITKQLRREGLIPAVIYGKNESKAVSIVAKEFNKKFHHISENTLITIKIGRKKHDVLIKDYQENHLKNYMVHIDFYEVEQGKLLRTNIPVHLEGDAKGVREGGLLEQTLHEIEVECTPKDIPEVFTLNIDGLETGESMHVDALEVTEGVRIITPEDATIVTITAPREEPAEEEAAEEEAEPEVIGAESEDEEAEPEEES